MSIPIVATGKKGVKTVAMIYYELLGDYLDNYPVLVITTSTKFLYALLHYFPFLKQNILPLFGHINQN